MKDCVCANCKSTLQIPSDCSAFCCGYCGTSQAIERLPVWCTKNLACGLDPGHRGICMAKSQAHIDSEYRLRVERDELRAEVQRLKEERSVGRSPLLDRAAALISGLSDRHIPSTAQIREAREVMHLIGKVRGRTR